MLANLANWLIIRRHITISFSYAYNNTSFVLLGKEKRLREQGFKIKTARIKEDVLRWVINPKYVSDIYYSDV